MNFFYVALYRSDRHRNDLEYLSSLTLFIPFNFSNKVNPVNFYTGFLSGEGVCLCGCCCSCCCVFFYGVGLYTQKYPPGTF